MASISQYRGKVQSTPALQTFVPQSSFISLFEYDQANLTLTSHLMSGSIYQHKMFLPASWADLITSKNHDTHWSRNVKGKHMSVRLKFAKAPKSAMKKHPKVTPNG
jgi:hypothetical protein